MSARSNELLRAAADAMEDGRDPFDTAFLSEHNVTLDECYGMGDGIAACIRFVLDFGDLAQARREYVRGKR